MATAAASFRTRRLHPGETVTVSTSLNLEGSHHGSYQFQVARPAGALPFEHRPAAPRVKGDVWYFRSRPDLEPAAVTITKRDPDAAGDIFIAPQVGPLQQGPEIIGPDGGLIWFDPLPTDYAATDFRVQTYQGRPVLTWWQGNETAGVGNGQDIIMNGYYQVMKTISAGNGLTADLHEFQLTPRGTALITAEFPGDAERQLGPRRAQRGGARLGGPGDRHPHRTRAVPVGQPRSRAAERRLHQAPERAHRQRARQPVRLLPHELDRARSRRQRGALGPQHVGRLQGQPPHRRGSSGRWAASTRASSSARACRSPSSTTCGSAPRAIRS